MSKNIPKTEEEIDEFLNSISEQGLEIDISTICTNLGLDLPVNISADMLESKVDLGPFLKQLKDQRNLENGTADPARIVPLSKYDVVAIENLKKASQETIEKKADELLEWIQDMNWPVAKELLTILGKIGEPLIEPIVEVFHGEDQMWKYWIITSLLPKMDQRVVKAFEPELERLKTVQTIDDDELEVRQAANEYLS